METVSVGVKFQPSTKEIIAYLLHMANGKPSRSDGYNFLPIETINVYDDKEPWEIFQEDQPYYFFMKLIEKPPGIHGRVTFCREVISNGVTKGLWQQYGMGTVLGSRGEEIGYVKYFVYTGILESNDDQDGIWLLREYSLANKFNCCVKEEYVNYRLCYLYKKRNATESDEENGSCLNMDRFFDQMLEENSKKRKAPSSPSDEDAPLTSTSPSSEDPPRTSTGQEKETSGGGRSQDLPDHSSPEDMDSEPSLKK